MVKYNRGGGGELLLVSKYFPVNYNMKLLKEGKSLYQCNYCILCSDTTKSVTFDVINVDRKWYHFLFVFQISFFFQLTSPSISVLPWTGLPKEQSDNILNEQIHCIFVYSLTNNDKILSNYNGCNKRNTKCQEI